MSSAEEFTAHIEHQRPLGSSPHSEHLALGLGLGPGRWGLEQLTASTVGSGKEPGATY